MLYEKIIHDGGSTFSHKLYPRFTMPWHYHPEYELIVIKSGGGKRFTGDHVEEYRPGDLVLFGSNLPHYHMCYGLVENDPSKLSASEVIQFPKEIFPEKMGSLKEFSQVASLLERSRRGVKFIRPPTIRRICAMMDFLDRQKGVKRIAALLRILEFLGREKNYKLLTSDQWTGKLIAEDENHPVNRVFRYLSNNFRDEITLEQVAEEAGFNPSALCRFFKRHAQISVFECLAEIRVGFACKLLVNSTYNISQVAYDVGYQNISNFNRQFKRIMGRSPSEYRELMKVPSDGTWGG